MFAPLHNILVSSTNFKPKGILNQSFCKRDCICVCEQLVH